MILVDTSVWIEVLKDKQGDVAESFKKQTQAFDIVLCRFVQMELLQGAKNLGEWERLDEYLTSQYYLEVTTSTWRFRDM